MGILASPLVIIDRSQEDQDINAIVRIINQYRVEHVIVGLPRSLDGSIGKQAEKVVAFTEKLRHETGVPIEFRDERLSTVSAKRLMQGVNKKAQHDAIAAALILQGYLDEGRVDES